MRNQSATPHARALAPYTGEHFDGRKLRGPGGVSYVYSGKEVQLNGEVKAAIRWAFGSGWQATTPVIERSGKIVEHRVSWYREGNRLGLTPGHDPAAPLDLEDALGVVETERNVERCFGCHQTLGEPGVTCQACHGDGTAHRAKPGRGTIARDRSVAVCSRCHRSPDAVYASPEPEVEDARSIRFAPVGLLASKCYKKSLGAGGAERLTCVSCHDPHGERPRAEPAKACVGCHAVAARTRRCPRGADCASCHMKASSPMPGLRFTDHRIRVYVE
ncbi:MAG: cytochrome c3 family protein [Bryobacteraceae bacterium]